MFSSFSHRGGSVWRVLGTLPHGAFAVELRTPVDRPNAQHLPVRPHPVRGPLLPQLCRQSGYLQPDLHTLPRMLPRTRVLTDRPTRLSTAPEEFAGHLRLQGPERRSGFVDPLTVYANDTGTGLRVTLKCLPRDGLQDFGVLRSI